MGGYPDVAGATPRPKVLCVANIPDHFTAFHQPTLRWFQGEGWEVHVATSGSLDLPCIDRHHSIPFTRSPFSWQTLQTYRALKCLLDREGFTLVHGHTPVGGALARLAARSARRQGTRVFYTAHGFHFYRGAPLLNWLLFYPVERLLAHLTDCLITITQEDFQRARSFKAGQVAHVPGVGVDADRFRPCPAGERPARRQALGLDPEALLLIYAAEFNRNKNQQLLVRAMPDLLMIEPKCHLLLAGDGPLRGACETLAQQLGVSPAISFLGERQDLPDLLPLCDIAVASSLREGLPVNVLEAMACGLPVVATDNRGHRELVAAGQTGFLASQPQGAAFARALEPLLLSPELRHTFGAEGRARLEASYSLAKVQAALTRLYPSKEAHGHA